MPLHFLWLSVKFFGVVVGMHATCIPDAKPKTLEGKEKVSRWLHRHNKKKKLKILVSAIFETDNSAYSKESIDQRVLN